MARFLSSVVSMIIGSAFFGTLSYASVAPIPDAKFEHAPYGDRVCSLCHQRDDENSPGPLNQPDVNSVCMTCHDGFSGKHLHKAMQTSCTNCHNPHNGNSSRFLRASVPALCTRCHTQIGNIIANSETKHGAVEVGKSCLNCHNPHASKVEKLLNGLPYDLCVNCHNTNTLVDHNGKRLANIKELIESRPYVHAPVAEKDCSACHQTHGSKNFRLLVEPFPATFYSPFEESNYALCFTCHDSTIVTEPETTNLTGFRNGDKNLHFLHVNREDGRGRTCRACHEVHAAEQPHNIRDGVPYGNRGWVLKIHYEQLPQGGRCAKTCHTTREYRR
ncbi:MAG: hypothetical protein A2X86_09365 [Bdellovibrionales bacterium GWA2_49_15]|nr:MAG: hypothetical protein A2X86_09365 [Bdellovibrionales bacterium GWA2_49_15]